MKFRFGRFLKIPLNEGSPCRNPTLTVLGSICIVHLLPSAADMSDYKRSLYPPFP